MPEEIITQEYEFPEEADMQTFRENPQNACEWMQRKYIWMTYEESIIWREWLVDYEWPIWEYQEIVDESFTNPYTHETKIVKVLHQLPVPTPEEVIKARIEELRMKLINWTITAEEREELKLLIW